jgi:hypothetical protein
MWAFYIITVITALLLPFFLADSDLLVERTTHGTGHDLRTSILLITHWVIAAIDPFNLPWDAPPSRAYHTW